MPPDMHIGRTENQIAASRANDAKSRCALTSEGKRKSARNSRSDRQFERALHRLLQYRAARENPAAPQIYRNEPGNQQILKENGQN